VVLFANRAWLGEYQAFANEGHTNLTDDWMATGKSDSQTVDQDWNIIGQPRIEGVACKEIRPVTTGKGTLTEVWRPEWALDGFAVGQIFQSLLDPGTVSDWHAHAETTDRLFCAMGRIRLALYDGRKSSPTYGAVWQRVFGHERPLLVVVPPGVWHGLKTLGTTPSLILNLVDRAYAYENPDHWRLPPDTPNIPFSLL
jgi:dTDP-4-dehydrorhamnose 3,5-epimerase